jgi:hypothetical protein
MTGHVACVVLMCTVIVHRGPVALPAHADAGHKPDDLVQLVDTLGEPHALALETEDPRHILRANARRCIHRCLQRPRVHMRRVQQACLLRAACESKARGERPVAGGLPRSRPDYASWPAHMANVASAVVIYGHDGN